MTRPASSGSKKATPRNTKPASLRTGPLRLETLEDRVTPDATIGFANNVIDIVGTDDRDVVRITAPQADRVHVLVRTGTEVVQRTIVVNNNTRIEVFGDSGDDVIDNRTFVPMRAFGSSGNDTILGGAGDDELRGNEGDDFIHGRNGNDLLSGNEGTDRIYGGHGHDEIHGDNGSRAAYNNGSQLSTGERDFLYGGPGVDAIFGNGGADLIYGQAGNDWLDGQGGTDLVMGDDGHDRLFGGTENDKLVGDAGDDLLDAGHGDDRLIGGDGNDDLRGDVGNDLLQGGNGNDVLAGSLGNDVMYGDAGSDSLDGSSGNDQLFGGSGRDELFGGSGNDYLAGEAGNDILEGGHDNDRLLGGAGHDSMNGGDGDDVLFGQGGHDEMHGGSGNDMLNGAGGNDRLHGDSGNDTLRGRSGSDILEGGSGNDLLLGDDAKDPFGGNDRLFGGDGQDYLGGYAGHDRLEGGPGPDTLRGHGGNDYLLDDADGTNSLVGGGGDNRIEFLFQPGQLHAAVAPDRKSLRLAGTDRKYPDSGFTFLTTSSWQTQVQNDSGGRKYTYSTSGDVYIDLNRDGRLDTSRDLHVRNGMTLYTLAAPSEEEAVIDPGSMSFSLLPGPLTDFLQRIKKATGLELGLPNFTLGIASGQTLMQADDTLPLRASQPYLHFTINSGLSLKFGSVELTSNTANNYLPQGAFKLIVDPTDPFVFAKALAAGSGAAVGVSRLGRIPYTPEASLDAWQSRMFGHVHIEVDGVPLPYGFSADGAVLLDLDANDDGRKALDMGRSLQAISPGGNFWQHIQNTLSDISVGVNGNLYFGDFKKFFKAGTFLNKFFSEIDTTVELARGSVVLDGHRGQIHFKGEDVNPFDDTPLESLEFLNGQMEVSGSVTNLRTGEPQVRMAFRAAGVADTLNVGLSLNNHGAAFRGEADVLGQSLQVYGSINTSGVITLNGTLRLGGDIVNDDTGKLGAGVYLDVHARASIAALRFRADVDLHAWVNALTYDSARRATGFTGDLFLNSLIDLARTGGTFSFEAKADLSLYINGTRFRATPSFQVTVGPNSLEFEIFGHEVEISW